MHGRIDALDFQVSGNQHNQRFETVYRDPRNQNVAAQAQEAQPATGTEAGGEIDLDRLVWDQEYRDEVRGQLEAA